jgi:DNA repair/transcription protein MET18/MMS19
LFCYFLLTKLVEHMATFLCSKLDDHYTVSTSALPGLDALVRRQPATANANSSNNNNHITPQKTLDIVRSLLKDIHVQSLTQSDRLLVYGVCLFMLHSGDERLVEIIRKENYETDFVYGFLQAMDGEKDPRNLLACFECLRLIGERLNLGPFVEETFEIFACYFPIDFTPVRLPRKIIK